MSKPTRPRWYATPLDPDSAAARARQLEALANPERLRVLSGIASSPDGTVDLAALATELDLDPEVVEWHIEILAGEHLLEPSSPDGRMTPTAETWIRFGRLIAGATQDQIPPLGATDSPRISGPTELPPVLHRITERLAYRFSSTFSKETVERYVADSYRRLAERAKVPQHLPSLTTRFAEERLGALVVAAGRELQGTPEVLFVCVQNSGRSQMAAAILRQLAGDRVHVRTAGSRPATKIDSAVVDVLDEIGVPVAAEFPKPLTDEVVQAADYVITMGCGDACPIYPGRRYMDWPVDDPVGLPREHVRRIRDEIADRIQRLGQELGITP